jgi:hypothetical protein
MYKDSVNRKCRDSRECRDNSRNWRDNSRQTGNCNNNSKWKGKGKCNTTMLTTTDQIIASLVRPNITANSSHKTMEEGEIDSKAQMEKPVLIPVFLFIYLPQLTGKGPR